MEGFNSITNAMADMEGKNRQTLGYCQ